MTDEELFDDIELNALPHIKYVHQLQNLYFAISGEELVKIEADKQEANYLKETKQEN